MRSKALVALLGAASLLIVACSGGGDDVVAVPQPTAGGAITDGTGGAATTIAPPPSTPVVEVAPIAWEPYAEGVEVGALDVPIDYADPSAGTFELFVARHLADPDQRIGSLLVNPGGPGFGGSDFAIFATSIYQPELLDRFDIVGWDPRGTGLSEPAIDCVEDLDPVYGAVDITPDTPEERQQLIDVAQGFTTSCVERNAAILQHVGTNDTARDIDAIRRALGEETISYFGSSYGSELGGVWATLYPDTVRAAVLDGAVDPAAGFGERLLSQLSGFESTLASFLAGCSADPSCAFSNGGNAEAAFDALMQQLDDAPLPSAGGRPAVNRAVAVYGVGQAMYSESLWPALERSLADAQNGDGAGLLGLYDAYFQRTPEGTYGNELEAFTVINCMDSAERLTVAEEDALAVEVRAAAPRMSPGDAGSYSCSFYPPSEEPRAAITGAGAGPILVIGTTGDAATPLAGTRVMADTLDDGRLVVVVADRHTGYGANECINQVVARYLIDLEVPPEGTECRP
jgi:pimeloyl-ACP methyl ester carboxylesterase